MTDLQTQPRLFLPIPKGHAQEKYRNNSPRTLPRSPDPRIGVETRHKDPGIKKYTSVWSYITLFGVSEGTCPKEDAFFHLAGSWAFASSRNHNGGGFIEMAFRTDPIPRKTEEKPQLVWDSLEWDDRGW